MSEGRGLGNAVGVQQELPRFREDRSQFARFAGSLPSGAVAGKPNLAPDMDCGKWKPSPQERAVLERDETDLVQCTTSTTDARHARPASPSARERGDVPRRGKVRQQTLRERVCES